MGNKVEIKVQEPIEYDESHYYLGNPRNHRIISKELYNSTMKEASKSIVLRPYKCEVCDSASCEYFLWCKGGNVEHE